jgi:hypothetical protein
VVEAHFVEHWDRLLFRDYLIEHPQVANEYQALKLRLASAYPNDRVAYTRGKGEFVNAITERARQLNSEPGRLLWLSKGLSKHADRRIACRATRSVGNRARSWKCFEGLAPSYRRMYIAWIDSAGQQDTNPFHGS